MARRGLLRSQPPRRPRRRRPGRVRMRRRLHRCLLHDRSRGTTEPAVDPPAAGPVSAGWPQPPPQQLAAVLPALTGRAGHLPCPARIVRWGSRVPGTRLSPEGRHAPTELSRVSWKLKWRSPARTGREVGVGHPPRHHRQGTAVTKKYQNREIDMPDALGIAVPERVSVAMAEIAGSMREGLLALAVGTGLQVMQVLMEADVTALAGPKGRHDPGRSAVRHGAERGSVTLGGRRVPVSRPRVRAADGLKELPVPSYELFGSTEMLGAMAMERM